MSGNSPREPQLRRLVLAGDTVFLAAAHGCLYVSTADGRVLALGRK